jgi:cation diffusion facilitator family transporter
LRAGEARCTLAGMKRKLVWPFDAALSAAALSIVAGALICAIKFAAYLATGSSAIFSDAVESVNNILAALVSAYAVWQSARSPDRDHPFGRGRLEYFSAGFEGGLIALAGVLILYEATPRIFTGVTLSRLDAGLALTAAGSALNAGLGWILVRVGRRRNSAALVADGMHVYSDVLTSLGLLAGLGLVRLTGWTLLDPLLAVGMALWLLYAGGRIVLGSFHRLMDRVSPATRDAVVAALAAVRRPEMILPHRLRLRETGPQLEADFHLIAPRFLTIEDLHRLELEIGRGLVAALGRPIDLLMHSDPCANEHCCACEMRKCPVRSEAQRASSLWRDYTLTADPHQGQEKILAGQSLAPSAGLRLGPGADGGPGAAN